MGLHDEAKLDQKFMEFAKLMNIHLNHFPKHEKYGLALEIRRAAYEVYGYIVEAQKRYHKKTSLTNLHARRTHSLQHMLRFSREHHHDHHHRLPEIYRRRDYSRIAPAAGY